MNDKNNESIKLGIKVSKAKNDKIIEGADKETGKKKDFLDVPKVKKMGDIKSGDARKNLGKSSHVVSLKKEEETKDKKSWRKYLIGALTILVGLVLGGFIVWYIFGMYFGEKDGLKKLVPEDADLYVWLDLENSLSSTPSLWSTLSKIEPLAATEKNYLTGLEKFLATNDLNLEELKNALGKEAALVNLPLDSGDPAPVLMVRLQNEQYRDKVLEIISKQGDLQEQEIAGRACYKTHYLRELQSPVIFTFIDDVVVIAKDATGLEKILAVSNKQNLPLGKNSDFKKTGAITGAKTTLFVYAKPGQLADDQALSFLPSQYLAIVTGYLAKEDFVSLAVEPEKDGLRIKTFSDDPGAGTKTDFPLLAYAPSDSAAVLAGYNLGREFLDLKSSWRENNVVLLKQAEKFELEIEGKYDFNIEDNLLNVFTGDYSIVLLRENNNTDLGLVFRVADMTKAEEAMVELEQAIKIYYSQLYPREQAITLPDGTAAVELLPDTETFKFIDLKIQDQLVRVIESGQAGRFVSYGFIGDDLLVATSKDALTKMIQSGTAGGSVGSLKSYLAASDKVFSSANSLYYLNIPALAAALGADGNGLTSLQNLVMVQRVSDEGTTSEGFLSIE